MGLGSAGISKDAQDAAKAMKEVDTLHQKKAWWIVSRTLVSIVWCEGVANSGWVAVVEAKRRSIVVNT